LVIIYVSNIHGLFPVLYQLNKSNGASVLPRTTQRKYRRQQLQKSSMEADTREWRSPLRSAQPRQSRGERFSQEIDAFRISFCPFSEKNENAV
jgi:hypothetical protein